MYDILLTGLKGMNFDHDFGNSFHLFSSLLKKIEEEKENESAKFVLFSISKTVLNGCNFDL